MLTEGRFFMSEPGGYQEPPVSPPPGGYQQPPTGGQIPGAEKKLVAGILAILLGQLGIHKFYLGYQKTGIIMLLVSLLTCGIGAAVMWVIGIIEGITYLMKTDQEFVDTYVVAQKEWF
jgi:TM2 domain-containing membrane protein YozV